MHADLEDGPPSANLLIFTEQDMGESDTQFVVCDIVVEQFTDFFESLGRRMKVGGNLQFQYRAGDPKAQVTPDVYILAGENPEPEDLSSWSVLEHGGKAPVLAIEVVSRTSRKDYTLDQSGMLARYQELGAAEVVRYDPLWHQGHRGRRRLLTHWTRSAEGLLVEQSLPQSNLVHLSSLGLWLIHTGPRRLRLGIGSPGAMTLWPTRTERIETERRRATAEAERADQAEAELTKLREELARLRGDSGL